MIQLCTAVLYVQFESSGMIHKSELLGDCSIVECVNVLAKHFFQLIKYGLH